MKPLYLLSTPRGRQALPMRRFSFHYHKSASLKQKRNVLSIHWQSQCHLVHHILCAVKIETHAQTYQPRCIMRGFARQVNLYQGVGKRKGGMVAHILS